LIKTEEERILFVDLDYDPEYGVKGKGVRTARDVLII